MAVLYGIDAFSILVPSTKKSVLQFFQKGFRFQKICFKVKVLKTLKISIDCHIKTRRSLKRKVILKMPSFIF